MEQWIAHGLLTSGIDIGTGGESATHRRIAPGVCDNGKNDAPFDYFDRRHTTYDSIYYYYYYRVRTTYSSAPAFGRGGRGGGDLRSVIFT